MLLARILGADRDAARWLLAGFGWSLVLVTVPAALVTEILGRPLAGRGFGGLVAVLSIVLAAVLLRRRKAPGEGVADLFRDWPFLLAPALVLLLALAPKFLWESLNGDGGHAFETARLATHRLIPFFDPAAGGISGFPGETSVLFAWPVSWFVRLFGPIAASARLPWLLAMVLLYAGILAVLGRGESRRPGAAERVGIWLGLGAYAVVMAYSASYNPYMADIALPAVQDTLLMACFLAFVAAFLDRRISAMAAFLLLPWMTLPNGLLLGGFWLVAAFLCLKPRPWKRLATVAGVLAGCFVLSKLLPPLLEAIGHPPPGSEYESLLERFRYVTLTDFRRILFVAVPCGVLPFLALFAFRKQDAAARALTLVTAAYFGFFYVQSRVSLHHFVPAMVIPLAVFWRMRARGEDRPLWTAAAAVLAVAALVVSLPADLSPHVEGRTVGSKVVDRRGGYEEMTPASLLSGELLGELFPKVHVPEVPDEAYGGSPLVWHHYARRGDEAFPETATYLLTAADRPAPSGFTLHAEEEGARLWIRSPADLEADLALRPGTGRICDLYRLSKNRLFRGVQREGEPKVYNLGRLLDRLGIGSAEESE
jgi:hypothetical protein